LLNFGDQVDALFRLNDVDKTIKPFDGTKKAKGGGADFVEK